MITLLLHTIYFGKFVVKLQHGRERGTAAQCEGNAGGSDQMVPNVQLEEVKFYVCGQKEY